MSAGALDTVIFSAVGPEGKRVAGALCRRIAMPTATAVTAAQIPMSNVKTRSRLRGSAVLAV